MRGLKVLLGVACLAIALIVFLWQGHKAPHDAAPGTPAAAAAGTYEWRVLWSGSLTVSAGAYTQLQVHQAPRARVTLKSKEGVSIGIVPQTINAEGVQSLEFDKLPCGAVEVSDAVRECEVPAGEGSLVVSYPGTLPRIVLDSLVIEGWRCTANCPKP